MMRVVSTTTMYKALQEMTIEIKLECFLRAKSPGEDLFKVEPWKVWKAVEKQQKASANGRREWHLLICKHKGKST